MGLEQVSEEATDQIISLCALNLYLRRVNNTSIKMRKIKDLIISLEMHTLFILLLCQCMQNCAIRVYIFMSFMNYLFLKYFIKPVIIYLSFSS